MRRTSFLSVTLLGLSLVPAVALAGPPSKQAPSRQVVNVQRGGQVTIVVPTAPAQASALSDKEEKGEKSDKGEKADKAEKAEKKEDPGEKARRGVVTIERAGEVVGLGTVLQNDGRILTALSPLGDGNNLAIRYADGSTVKTKVGHSDRLWDMAMLVPQVGKWPEGLVPSDADPTKQGAQLRSFSPGKGKAQMGPVGIKGRKSFLGADETMLRDAFDISTKLGARDVGSPIIDEQGNVVAMVGRACVPIEKGPCAPTPFGIPVRSVRRFLSSAPPSAVRPAPFLGIQGALDKASAVPGVKVAGVFPESPADEAGVKAAHDKDPGDTIVAVDDHPVTSPSALSETIMQKSVGDRVKLLLFGNGKFRETTVVLQPPPAKKLSSGAGAKGISSRSTMSPIDRISPTLRPEGPAAGYHKWRSLLFLHWEVPAEQIEPLLPPGLTLDTFDGKAYVGLVPFTMHGIRPSRYLPAVPGVSAFHETNVRTYVHARGQAPGVWFFSLDAANPVAVTAARVGWHLPYFFARMSLDQQDDTIHYTSRRLYPPPKPAELDVTWRIGEELGSATPGTFEHFLCERYFLYATRHDGTLLRGQVHHTAYPLRRASVESIQDSILAAAGFPVAGPPVSALYSPGVDVEVFDLDVVPPA